MTLRIAGFADADELENKKCGIKLYSWRKTLAFFVVASTLGWVAVFGFIWVLAEVLT